MVADFDEKDTNTCNNSSKVLYTLLLSLSMALVFVWSTVCHLLLLGSMIYHLLYLFLVFQSRYSN